MKTWNELNKYKLLLYCIVLLAVMSTGVVYCFAPNHPIPANLFTEALGILFTIVVIDLLLRWAEEEKWKNANLNLGIVLAGLPEPIVDTIQRLLVGNMAEDVDALLAFAGLRNSGLSEQVLDRHEAQLRAMFKETIRKGNEDFAELFIERLQEHLDATRAVLTQAQSRLSPQQLEHLLQLSLNLSLTVRGFEYLLSQAYFLPSVRRNGIYTCHCDEVIDCLIKILVSVRVLVQQRPAVLRSSSPSVLWFLT